MPAITLESVLICKRCGFAKTETTPSDACQFYYESENCKCCAPSVVIVVSSAPNASVNCPPAQRSARWR
jgi:hypothetical protein